MIRTVLVVSVALMGLSACQGPKVLGTYMSKAAVCPNADTRKCVQSAGGNTPLFIEKPQRLLGLQEDGTPRYWDVLGHEFDVGGDLYSGVCGGDPFDDPLKNFAAAQGIAALIPKPSERTFNFSREASTRWKVSDTSADAAQIVSAAGVPATVGPVSIAAEVEGALDRFSTSKIEMTGRYVFVEVDRRIVQSLRNPSVAPELASCANWLRQSSDNSVVTSLTGVLIETSTDSSSLKSTLTAGLDASLSTVLSTSQLAQLKAEVERKVDTSYSGEFAPTFQLLSIGHASIPK